MTSYSSAMRRLRPLSIRELIAARDRIEHDPANRSAPGSFNIYTRPAISMRYDPFSAPGIF